MGKARIEQICPKCKQTRLIRRVDTRKANFTGMCGGCSRSIYRKRLDSNKEAQACPQCKVVRVVYKPRIKSGLCYKCSRRSCNLMHGESKTKLYRLWAAMKNRCLNPNHSAYAYYGGRNITVCDRWLNSYESFRDDMGYPPPGTSLDRRDNSKGYDPANCYWATRKQQMNNVRSNRAITFDGRTQTLAQWEEELGLSHTTLWRRLKAGWPMERALVRVDAT